MTMTTHLPNGTKGKLASPEHRLLRRLYDFTGPTYLPAGEGATVKQLRALERDGTAKLVRNGFVVLGAHLTAKGEHRLELLDAAQAHRDRIEAIANGGAA